MAKATVCAWTQEDETICIHQQPPDGEVGDPCILIQPEDWAAWAEGFAQLVSGAEPMVDLPGRFAKIEDEQ